MIGKEYIFALAMLMACMGIATPCYPQSIADYENLGNNMVDPSTITDGVGGSDSRKDVGLISDSPSGSEQQKNSEMIRLGFVNYQRVMASIPQLNYLRKQLDSEFSQQRATLNTLSSEIEGLESRLDELPRGEEYSELEKRIIAKRRTFARLDASMRDAYSVRRNEELATLQQFIVDEIVGLAKEKDYDVILNDTGVIFVSAEADLTPLVIERLQAQDIQHNTNDDNNTKTAQ